jgi:hypothetical protein
MQRKRINLEAVRACLDTVCRKCGHKIPPDKIQRIDSARVKCPACGEAFEASQPARQPMADNRK